MITRWVRALRQLETGGSSDLCWADYATVTEEDRIQHLRTVGAVNMKKSAGGHTTDPATLRAEAKADAGFLDQQLGLYKPDLVICCGGEVAGLAAGIPLLAEGDWMATRRGLRYWRTPEGCVVVDYCHPEVRVGRNLPMVFFPLIDGVEEIWSGCSGLVACS